MKKRIKQSKAQLAAKLVLETGCSYSEAAKKYGITHGPVAKACRRLKKAGAIVGLVVKTETAEEREHRQRVGRAVTFAKNHDTSIRRAAAVYSVPAQDVCDAFNARYGARRVLVGNVWRLV